MRKWLLALFALALLVPGAVLSYVLTLPRVPVPATWQPFSPLSWGVRHARGPLKISP